MNKMKRGIAWLLIATMVIGCLAGCFSSVNEAKAATKTGEQSTTSNNTNSDVSELEQTAISLLSTHGSEQGKEETVYILADADGNVTKKIVNAWLKNPEEKTTIEDKSELQDIENVSGEETFTQNGNQLVWDAQGDDIMYQGTSDKELPLDVEITYTLDGKQVTAEELAGASGHLVIEYTYTNNTGSEVEVNGEMVTMYQPFLVISGMALSSDVASNIKVTNGKVINTSDKNLVVGMAMPGLTESLGLDELKDSDGKAIDINIPEDVTIEADVTDFSLLTAVTVYDNSALTELNLDDVDTLDDLQKAMDDLTDATEKLIDGTEKLNDGTSDLKDGTSKLKDGSKTLADGVSDYTDGVSKVNDGIQTLSDKVPTLTSGIDKLYKGTTSASEGAAKLLEGFVKKEGGVLSGALALKDGSATLNAAINDNPISLKDSDKETIGKTASEGASAYSSQFANGVCSSLADNIDKSTETVKKQGAAGASAQAETFAKSILQGISSDVKKSEDSVASKSGKAAEKYAEQIAAGVTSQLAKRVEGKADSIAEKSGDTAADYASKMADGACDAIASTIKSSKSSAVEKAEKSASGTDLDALIAMGLAYQATGDAANYQDYLSTADGYVTKIAGDTAEATVDAIASTVGSDSTSKAVSKELSSSLKKLGSGIGSSVTEQIADSLKSDSSVEKVANGLEDTLNKIGSGVASQVVEGIASNLTTSSSIDSLSSELADGLSTLGGTIASQTAAGISKTIGSDSTVSQVSEGLSANLGTLGSGIALQTADSLVSNINKALPETLGVYTSQLADGTNSLYTGLLTVSEGIKSLDSGLSQLDNGMSSLKEGSGTLASGVKELSKGSATLNSNSKKLNDGAKTLAEGTTTLDDGAGKLLDGSSELLDGLKKFNDEGISKLASLAKDDLQNVIDRLKALQKYAETYTTYSGADEAMDSTVRFIMRTESIGKED